MLCFSIQAIIKAATAEASAEAKSHITISKLSIFLFVSKTNQETPHIIKNNTNTIHFIIVNYLPNVKLLFNNEAISLNGARKAVHNSFLLCEAPYSSGHTLPLIDR